MKDHDLQDRLFVFAIGIIKMLRLTTKTTELKNILGSIKVKVTKKEN